MLFVELARRTGARVVEDFQPASVRSALCRGRVRSLLLRGVQPRPRLASTEMLQSESLRAVVERTDPVAVGIYDDPVGQAAAVGVRLSSDRAAELVDRRRSNGRAFRWHVVPTASFAELIGLEMGRVIVGTNGTDTSHIRVEPWPSRPAVGFISGAAPGRGIEALIEAGRRLRDSVADLEILLWLVGTGEGSRQYLAELRASVAREAWVRIETASHDQLSAALGRASVMCIPHPDNAYLDVALPVKLLDSMAAGRPVVVTPRLETAAIVRRSGCGLVTSGDSADDLADAISRLLHDDTLARHLGAAGRRAAQSDYDWSVVGSRIADEILRRERVAARASP